MHAAGNRFKMIAPHCKWTYYTGYCFPKKIILLGAKRKPEKDSGSVKWIMEAKRGHNDANVFTPKAHPARGAAAFFACPSQDITIRANLGNN
jgi:hypothetical protein